MIAGAVYFLCACQRRLGSSRSTTPHWASFLPPMRLSTVDEARGVNEAVSFGHPPSDVSDESPGCFPV